MGKRVAPEIKAEILRKIESGRTVADVSAEHGVSVKAIYRWLGKKAEGGKADLLEVSRLRRENEALLRIIGQFTYEKELRGKKGSH